MNAWVSIDSRHPDVLAAVAAACRPAGLACRPGPEHPGRPEPPPALLVVGADRLSDRRPRPHQGVPWLVLAPAGWPEVGIPGIECLRLPEAGAALAERMAEVGAPAADALVLGVVGAVGGAGASVFAASLARCAGDLIGRTLLLGADPVSGGLGLLFAGELGDAGAAPDLGQVRGRLLPGSLAGALPEIDGVHVLDRCAPSGLPAEAMTSVLGAALRDFDAVVADLPRHLDDAAGAVLAATDLVLLLVPATAAGVRSARVLADGLVHRGTRVRAVVRGPLPPGLRLPAIAEAVGVPVQLRMAAEPGLSRALARGEPPGLRRRSTLAVAARSVLRRAMTEHEPGDRPLEARRRVAEGWLEELIGHG